MLTLDRVVPAALDWVAMDALEDRVLFQTREWLTFVQGFQKVEPVVAAVRDGSQLVGWFTGLVGQRWGVRILGAPLPGWNTPYLGFNLVEGVSRQAAFAALPPFAFHQLHCAHVEVCDRWTSPDELGATGAKTESTSTFVLDLRKDEVDLLAGMTSGTRQNLRKGERVGLVVEDARPQGFAREYYDQLVTVFAKQRMVPPYGPERVESLIDNLYPTGRLQLIRVRSPEGTSIATALIAGLGRSAYFWGGASWREHQHLRPNEALFWHAFTTWKARGAEEFDFGGGGDYKRKYGAVELTLPHARWSRWPGLEPMRDAARRGVAARQRARGALASRT